MVSLLLAENIHGWCAFRCDHPHRLRHNWIEQNKTKQNIIHHIASYRIVCQKWWWQSAIYFKTSSQMLHACNETTNECRTTDRDAGETRNVGRHTHARSFTHSFTNENTKITTANVLKTTVNETWDRVTVWCALHGVTGKWQSKRRIHNDKNKHSSLTNAKTNVSNGFRDLAVWKHPKTLDSITVLEL